MVLSPRDTPLRPTAHRSCQCACADPAERAARLEAEADAAQARAVNTSIEALIAHMKLEIEKLRRALYGSRSERKARLLEQMELRLEELEAAATEDQLAAEKRRPGCRRCDPSRGRGRRASRSPSICRASAW
jgi:hypothetical protein